MKLEKFLCIILSICLGLSTVTVLTKAYEPYQLKLEIKCGNTYFRYVLKDESFLGNLFGTDYIIEPKSTDEKDWPRSVCVYYRPDDRGPIRIYKIKHFLIFQTREVVYDGPSYTPEYYYHQAKPRLIRIDDDITISIWPSVFASKLILVNGHYEWLAKIVYIEIRHPKHYTLHREILRSLS